MIIKKKFFKRVLKTLIKFDSLVRITHIPRLGVEPVPRSTAMYRTLLSIDKLYKPILTIVVSYIVTYSFNNSEIPNVK